ncbi:MAG: hypothetical protein JW893_07915 [Candidatus Omnitrophica bacterium]|nr:hypothetical protein [Candidatus Omnitrophota bacterium]
MKIKFTSSNDAMHQASETAKKYMYDAQGAINKRFGAGYAEQHPDLMAAFMQTAALDFMTSFLAKCLQDIDQSIISLKEVD